MDKFRERLSKVRTNIDLLDKKEGKRGPGYVLLFIIAAVVVSAGLFLGMEDTGMVVFSEDTVHETSNPFFIDQSMSMVLVPPIENPKTLMLTGEVFGEGTAEVFLLKEGKKELIYYFQGKAGQGKMFIDACSDTCYTDIGGEAKLIVNLEGTKLRIDNVKYVSSRVIDFELQPKRVDIDYKTEPVKTFEVKLLNKLNRDFDVFLYIDGPLSDSFSWQGSMIHLGPNDDEKTVLVNVQLPDNLVPGEYPNKITARYVPKGDIDFQGSAPVDEMFVVVKN